MAAVSNPQMFFLSWRSLSLADVLALVVVMQPDPWGWVEHVTAVSFRMSKNNMAACEACAESSPRHLDQKMERAHIQMPTMYSHKSFSYN